METESVAKRAIALITERGAIRTDQIAEALGVDKAAIASSLGPYVNSGALVACKVERPGGGMPVNEYRISAGGKLPAFRQLKVKAAPRAESLEAAAAPYETPAARKPAEKRSAPVRKVQRKTARTASPGNLRAKDADLRIPYAGAPAGAFRTAIASDGAMIFLGAARGAFELTREEARAVVGFVRELDGGKLAA